MTEGSVPGFLGEGVPGPCMGWGGGKLAPVGPCGQGQPGHPGLPHSVLAEGWVPGCAVMAAFSSGQKASGTPCCSGRPGLLMPGAMQPLPPTSWARLRCAATLGRETW